MAGEGSTSWDIMYVMIKTHIMLGFHTVGKGKRNNQNYFLGKSLGESYHSWVRRDEARDRETSWEAIDIVSARGDRA